LDKTENKNSQNIQSFEQVDIFLLLKILYHNKKIIILLTFLISLISSIYVLLVTPAYKSVVTLYPNKKASENPFSALISGYGVVNKIGVYHIPEVIKSKRIRDEIILRKYKTKAFTDSVNLIQYWELDKSYEKLEYQLEVANMMLSQRVNVRDNKETYLITIRVRMPERLLAADIANYIGGAVTSYLQHEERKTLVSSREYLQKRYKDSKARLNRVETEYIQFKEKNFKSQSPQLNAELIRHDRKFRIAQDVYVMISKQLELMLLEEVRVKPVVAILDKGVISMFPVYPRKKYIVVVNTMLAFILIVVALLFKEKYYTKDILKKFKNIFR
jgi:capsular polysaccharide biosynthesis protein